MIKSLELLEEIRDILDKDQIIEEDLNDIEDLTLNKYKLNGKENDINLEELRYFKNLKTLTLIKFRIDKNIIKYINDNNKLLAIQFSNCDFEEIIPINPKIEYIVLDCCKNANLKIINDNKIIKIIGANIDLENLNQLNNTEELYLQNCQITNIEKILNYNNLKELNLDGSTFESDNIFRKLDSDIKISYKNKYNPVGGI